MRFVFSLFFVLNVAFLHAQNNAEEKMVIKTITNFFEGFHAQDSTKMYNAVYKTVLMQSISKTTSKDVTLSLTNFKAFVGQIKSIPETDSFKEVLLSFEVKIDGNMANVWTPYEFWYNDKKRHCGVNSFQLIKENRQWKIFYIVDTRRSCN